MWFIRLTVLILSLGLSLHAKSAGFGHFASERDSTITTIDDRYRAALERLKEQGRSLVKYATEHNYNSNYCILVDMSLPSGKKRMFVYNLKKDSIEYATLVANGVGSYREGREALEFSNTLNSGMTSLGKYSIGNSYYGNFGLSYKLHGLDSTNSNAFVRTIVLHSFSQMPDIEIYPRQSALSAGCPMVSASSFALLSQYIRATTKPVLLWIYN